MRKAKAAFSIRVMDVNRKVEFRLGMPRPNMLREIRGKTAEEIGPGPVAVFDARRGPSRAVYVWLEWFDNDRASMADLALGCLMASRRLSEGLWETARGRMRLEAGDHWKQKVEDWSIGMAAKLFAFSLMHAKGAEVDKWQNGEIRC